MLNILHKVGIKAPLDEVYKAWTTRVSFDSEPQGDRIVRLTVTHAGLERSADLALATAIPRPSTQNVAAESNG